MPFKSKFQEFTIVDPLQVFEAFDHAEKQPDVHTIVIDSLTFLMDQYETIHVLPSSNTLKMWGEYNQYLKKLMQQKVAASTKNVIFTAHTQSRLNESEMVIESAVPIKGAAKGVGVESYFSCILSSKKIPLKTLEAYPNKLLTVTPQDEAIGFKHVFQTMLTKDTVNERIRSPLGMWDVEETFIDNNIQLVINRLDEYYT